MTRLVLWRRLTETDFNAMHGQAAPSGGGGGAMHIALGVQTETFPIAAFIGAGRRTKVTLATAGQPGRHSSATLTFRGNPNRRGGDWLIADQYTHRHPGWSASVGFPATYD